MLDILNRDLAATRVVLQCGLLALGAFLQGHDRATQVELQGASPMVRTRVQQSHPWPPRNTLSTDLYAMNAVRPKLMTPARYLYGSFFNDPFVVHCISRREISNVDNSWALLVLP
jgi:hypothetical protein